MELFKSSYGSKNFEKFYILNKRKFKILLKLYKPAKVEGKARFKLPFAAFPEI